jgi:bile acid:Na+ symporter, BASS family
MTTAALLGMLFLIAFNLNVGLQCTRRELLESANDRWALARAVVLIFAVVPAAAFFVAHGFHLQGPLLVAMITLAVCPGAPLAPSLARKAGTSVPFTVLLLLIAGIVVPFTAPLTARLLLGYRGALDFNPLPLIGRLLLLQLLPIAIGVAWKTRRPRTAATGEKITRIVYAVLLLAVVLLGIIPKIGVVLEIGAIGLLATLVLMLVTWFLGWFAGGPSTTARRTLAAWINVPNPGVATLLTKGAGAPPEYLAAIHAMFLVRVLLNLVYLRASRSVSVKRLRAAR